MKRQRITYKRGRTVVEISKDDVMALVIGGVAMIAAVTFSLLLLEGRVSDAVTAFAFLSGLGFGEGVRYLINKNT
ncbi:MAG: hypothetical protein NZ920_01225 [Aigarchaeota archaeon]|nr:hypothetical protein [Aigarchaeota archaeon]MDW8093062.1 hypothetical protein [Nitrososphaerota archaeon]